MNLLLNASAAKKPALQRLCQSALQVAQRTVNGSGSHGTIHQNQEVIYNVMRDRNRKHNNGARFESKLCKILPPVELLKDSAYEKHLLMQHIISNDLRKQTLDLQVKRILYCIAFP